MQLCAVECNYCTTLRITSGRKHARRLAKKRILITHHIERPTVSHVIVVPCLRQCNKASREAESDAPRHRGMLFLCGRRQLVATQPEVALASWWNNQDSGRLLSQYGTLCGPCPGLLQFADMSMINISHLSCNLIGHADIVAWCTSQCIRLNPTLPCVEGSHGA